MTPLITALATDVDDIKIVFNESSLTTLKIVIGLILFGIALDTDVEDFKRAARRPGTIAIGVAAQFLLLPAITFLLTLLLDVRGSVALGMILVACCPPGNVCNILTHRAGGDVALSVSMTAVSNLLAIFLMPLNMAFWGGLHPTGSKLLEDIDLSPAEMLVEVGPGDRRAVRPRRHAGPAVPEVLGRRAQGRRSGLLHRARRDHRHRRGEELGRLRRTTSASC